MDQILEFFEREGMPDKERISGDMHDLVGQDESAAEVLFQLTGETSMPSGITHSLHSSSRTLHVD